MTYTRKQIAQGIAAAQAAGDHLHVPLLQGVYDARINLIDLSDRAARLSSHGLRRIHERTPRPTLVLIGDDDYRATGPAGWVSAGAAVAWCRYAIVHGSGADPEFYRQAVAMTEAAWKVLLVETSSAHIITWANALAGKPGLFVVPPDNGAHPVTVAPGERH